MNRIILIGNGFDLAHGLKTSYANFIDWYWDEWGEKLLVSESKVVEDDLCSFELNSDCGHTMWYTVWGKYYQRKNPLLEWDPKEIVKVAKEDGSLCHFSYKSDFFKETCQSLEEKKWVDIENEYYGFLKKYAIDDNNENSVKLLNNQLRFIKNKLIEYLNLIEQEEINLEESIRTAIYSPLNPMDISIKNSHTFQDHTNREKAMNDDEWRFKLVQFGYSDIPAKIKTIKDYKEERNLIEKLPKFIQKRLFRINENPLISIETHLNSSLPYEWFLPNSIMFLTFNYTKTAEMYCNSKGLLKYANLSPLIHIHGVATDSKNVIFGYGDELDEKYKELVNKNDNQCLENIKSIKYLNSFNYRRVLRFIEEEPYQVFIMGHSCGNSDRTLLNTLFEHKNCVSIKPFYHKWDDGTDNYMELVQNIYRNFTDMKLMRDRVVNKTFCETI